MFKLLNQKGYTLIIVLLTIVIISLFSLTLFPKSFNTTLQVNKSEAIIQAKDLAEMGFVYSLPLLQGKLQKAIEKGKQNTSTDALNVKFCKALRDVMGHNTLNNTGIYKGTFGDPIPIINDTNNFQLYYEISYLKVNNEPLLGNTCEGFNHVEIKMISSGNIVKDSVTQKDINYTLLIKNRLIEEKCPISDPTCEDTDIIVPPDQLKLEIISTNQTYIVPNSDPIFYTSVQFNSTVRYNGGRNVSIGGNAWFNGSPSVDFRGKSGELFIVGDAYFRHPIDFTSGGNFVCVGGNAYKFNPSTNKYVDYDDLKTEKNCPPFVFEKFKYFLEAWELYGDLGSEVTIHY